MKMRHFIFLICCLFSITQCGIQDTNSITKITDHITQEEYNRNTIVIFDIDNTIAMPLGALGSDHWFSATIKKLTQKGNKLLQAVDITLPTYFAIHETIDLVPVESDTVLFIKSLQEKGLTVIALTARSPQLINRTREQLDKININFASSAPNSHHNLIFTVTYQVHYEHGIVFCGNNDKGKALLAWLERVNYSPKKIIFIDDKHHNVQNIEQAVASKEIKFIGLRFSGMDKKIASFDLKQTEDDLQTFYANHPELTPIP